MPYIIFKCAKAHLNARLAQLVEQRTENPCVSGSIPEPGIKNSIFGVLFCAMFIFCYAKYSYRAIAIYVKKRTSLYERNLSTDSSLFYLHCPFERVWYNIAV